MANAVDHLQGFNEALNYYSASYSPFLQGTEITQAWQLTNFLSVKIRGNISLEFVKSGSSSEYLSNSDNISAYNDTNAPENFGTLIAKRVPKYTLGRAYSSGSTGTSTYVTFLLSGTQGFAPSGSIRSQASLFVPGRLDTYVNHVTEQRDLGQSADWISSRAFEECDPIDSNPVCILQKTPEELTLPSNLVQICSSPASYDGVIEAMTIRSIIDRSSIELPYVAKGIKSSLSISNEKGNSYLIDDVYDIRQRGDQKEAAPFLDSVEVFGMAESLIDQPGAFSDSFENLAPYIDTTNIESQFQQISNDIEMISFFTAGVVSGSVRYNTPDLQFFPTYLVSARHGFAFSQKDNYGYDSIAFGGLKK